MILEVVERAPDKSVLDQTERPTDRGPHEVRDAAFDQIESVVSPASQEDKISSSLPREDADFREIIDEFLVQLKIWVTEMRQAFERHDVDALRRLAHTLKGSAGMAGFHGFTGPAARLGELIREEKWKEADEILEAIEQKASRAAR